MEERRGQSGAISAPNQLSLESESATNEANPVFSYRKDRIPLLIFLTRNVGKGSQVSCGGAQVTGNERMEEMSIK